MRDLEADKAICDNATRGPWDAMKPIIGRRAWCVVEQKEQGDGYHNLVCRRANTKNSEADWNNIKFIAAAREGWPHAIERAIKAEAENARLRKVAEAARVYLYSAKTASIILGLRARLSAALADLDKEIGI